MNKSYKFLLLGKTGHGKSATGNTMIGKRVFKSSAGGDSQTSETDSFHRKCKDFDIFVVDSPGLLDTRLEEQQDIESATKCYMEALAKCEGSIHAFLLVIKFKTRFTADENKVVESLAAIFGENFFSHVIVVITGGDDFQNTMEDEGKNITFKDWCGEETGPLAGLFNKCDHRVVLFNNREKTKEGKDEQLKQIIDIVNDWGTYTNQCFEDANQQREELIAKHMAPILKTEFQKAICAIQLDVNKFTYTPREETKEDITKKINELLKKIKDEDKGRGLFKELETNLEQLLMNLDNKEKLTLLNEELDELRKCRDKWGKIKTAASITGAVLIFASVVLAFIPFAGPALGALGAGAAACRLAPLAGNAIRAAFTATSAVVSGASAAFTALTHMKHNNCKTKVEIIELQKEILEKKAN